MTESQWRVNHARGGHAQAETRRWRIKSMFQRRSVEWSSCNSERNSCGSGNKHWLSSFHPNWGFANAEGVGKICSQAADRGTEGASERNLQGHAGLREPWSRIYEDHHHNGEETWVYGCDPETKFQSFQWKHPESPRPKNARQVRSKVKVMLTCFLILVALYITNTHQKAKQLTKSTIWRFYVDFVQLCKKAARHVESKKFSAPPW